MRTAPVLLLSALVFQVSCGEPDIPTNRTPSDGGVLFGLDGGEGDDGGGSTPGGCPGSIPKVGESCGPGTDESTSCNYPLGQCMANGMSYNETATYCCPNGVWEACGGDSPCDIYLDAAAPPPPQDGGVADAGADGPDGGNDTAAD
jgi:hypothetical protein